ncbi:MAG: S8 family serine peptidase, partial [bacterium]
MNKKRNRRLILFFLLLLLVLSGNPSFAMSGCGLGSFGGAAAFGGLGSMGGLGGMGGLGALGGAGGLNNTAIFNSSLGTQALITTLFGLTDETISGTIKINYRDVSANPAFGTPSVTMYPQSDAQSMFTSTSWELPKPASHSYSISFIDTPHASSHFGNQSNMNSILYKESSSFNSHPTTMNEKSNKTLEFAISTYGISRQIDRNRTHDTNELLIIFKPDISMNEIDQIHREYGVSLENISPFAGFHRVTIPQGAVVENIRKQYEENPLVFHAEPNYVRGAHSTPNDPYYMYQWHLNSLYAPFAWDLGSGEGAVVAILDSGVAYQDSGVFGKASDLENTIFTPGWDFVNDDEFPDDDYSHGTHLAGCIAQTTDNKLGVAGIAPGAAIMPIKIMDSDGYVSIADEADGIYYAVNNGADIINLSLGGEGISLIEKAAIKYAYDNGVIVICSAGNASSNIPEYPASYASAVSVGALQYN